jgi:hypothetical protein
MNVKWDGIQRVAAVVLEKQITVTAEHEDLERLEILAKRRGTSLNLVMREALIRGTHVEDVKELEDKMDKLLRERSELSEKRDKLARVFASLSRQDSTLRYRYYELFSGNRSLTVNLCGYGLGRKYPELLNRYLFANNPRKKTPCASGQIVIPHLA